MDTIGFYVSIASGVLLTISEILPYIKTIKSNGIIQCIIDTLRRKGSDSELDPLLNNETKLDTLNQQMNTLEEQMNTLEEQMNILQKQRLVISKIDTDKKLTIVIESVGN